MKNLLYYWLIQKFHIKLVLKTIFVEAVTVISKQNNWLLLWKCVRVGLGPWGRLRALDQSCDSPSRLGVKAIAHVHLHLDKRHINEDLLKTFSIHNVQSTFQLFSFVNWKVVIISESMSQKICFFTERLHTLATIMGTTIMIDKTLISLLNQKLNQFFTLINKITISRVKLDLYSENEFFDLISKYKCIKYWRNGA